jgi:YVTN family beta-propeller protein
VTAAAACPSSPDRRTRGGLSKKVSLAIAGSLIAVAAIAPTAHGLASTLSNPTVPVDPNVTLPITNFDALAVNSGHSQLFISTGAATNSLLVLNDSGVVTNTLPLAGAKGLSLNGQNLFVAESGSADIAIVDTSTLKVTHRISTGAATCPDSVTLVASRYVTYGQTCDGQWGSIGVIDITAKAPTATPLPGNNLFYNPIVRSVPNSTTAIVGDVGLDPSSVSIINVAGTPSVVTRDSELSNGCENLQDLAVSPDGKTFVPACGWPYRHDAFSTADLSLVDSYPTGTYPSAAAFSSNGKAFAGGTGFSYAKALYVSSTVPGNHAAGLIEDFGTPWATAPQGVAFSSDGTTVFDVTKAWFGAVPNYTYALHVLTIVKTPVSLYASTPVSWGVGTQLQIAGSVTFADHQQHTVQLQVSRRQNGVTTVLPPVTTTLGANTFSFTDTPPLVGTASYTITYAGDVFNKYAALTAKVTTQKMKPVLSLTPQIFPGGASTVTARLVGGTTNHAVTITARPAGGKSVVVATGLVDSLGVLAASYHITASTTFAATYTGDAQYTSATTTAVASPQTVTPVTQAPADPATVAVENTTPDSVSLELSNSSFDQTVVLGPNAVGSPIDYPSSTADGLLLKVLSGNDGGLGSEGSYFAAGHSYLVRIVYLPAPVPQPSGGHLLTWQIIETS